MMAVNDVDLATGIATSVFHLCKANGKRRSRQSLNNFARLSTQEIMHDYEPHLPRAPANPPAFEMNEQQGKRSGSHAGNAAGLTQRVRSAAAERFPRFPLVAEPVKVAALNAWRDVRRGLIS